MTDTTKILPKLRFPEFKNDGEWKVMKFKDIFTMLSNNTLSRAELSEKDGLALNVHYGDVLIKFGERLDLNNDNLPHIKDDEILHKYKSSYLEDGDVIFADTAEDETAGKCTEIRNIGKQIVISGLHTIPCRPKNEFAPYYWGYYLNSNIYHTKLLPLMQGAKVTSISRSSLQETTVVYPPTFPEQQKIAAFLTSLDEQISAHTKKLEALKAHKKGLMQQLFPANGEKTPKLRFPEFKNNGEWEEVRLGEIGTLKNGYAFKSDSYKESGVYKIITISNVKNGYLDLSKYNTIDKIPSDISDHQILNIEDILISMTGNVGRVCMVSETDCLLNQRVGIFQVYEGINKYFIFSILNSPSFENAMILAAQGAAQPNIGKFDIEKFSLLMPPTTFEQQRIASFLTSIDEMIQAQDDKIRKLKTYKNGLMQQMFVMSK